MNFYMEQNNLNAENSEDSLREKAVIDLAKEQGVFSRKELEKRLGISQTSCGRLLKQMVESGYIVQVGKGRNTRYHLVK